jgi:3-oxoacyl-[acyl-carrier-protein] synthase II
MDRRVVITGFGVVTPIGIGKEPFWEAAKAGQSGTGPTTLVTNPDIPIHVAGEVKDFDPLVAMTKKLVVRTDRNTQFAFVACQEALADSGLDIANEEDKDRIGIVLASNYGGLSYYLDNLVRLHQKGPSFVSAYMAIAWIPSAPVGQLSIFYGTTGYSKTVVNDSTGGTDAMGVAFRAIRAGDADVILTGGFEAALAEAAIAGLSNAPDICRDADDPASAFRPFDSNRGGIVVAEGGALFVFEEYERAKARGATIYAEVVGFAQTNDAYDLHRFEPTGEQYARAMRLALGVGGLTSADVSYINADGRATVEGDRTEAKAIRLLLGERADEVPVSAPKSMVGNSLAGAGAIDLAFATLAIYHGVVPPTINITQQDPECNINVVTTARSDGPVEVAVVGTRGTGGSNSAMVLRKVG